MGKIITVNKDSALYHQPFSFSLSNTNKQFGKKKKKVDSRLAKKESEGE